MRKTLLFAIIIMASAFTSKAQYNLTMTYDATQGSSTLQGAAKVYIHSGASDVAGPLDGSAWNYLIGNWGQDDGVGEMANIGTDLWTITFDPIAYYSAASNGPVVGTEIFRIGMIFRDADGTNMGKDANNSEIYLDLSTSSPAAYNSDGTPFFGVTAGISSGINTPSGDRMGIYNAPNPVVESTVFAYNLTGNQTASLSIYDATGRLVKVLFNEMQTSGKHYYNWIGDDTNGNLLGGGVYYYSLVAGNQKVSGKLVIVR